MRPLSPHATLAIKLAALFVGFVLFTVVFVWLTHEVLKGDTLSLDNSILYTINSWSTPFWNQFFLIATQFGDVPAVVGIMGVTLAILIARRRYHKAIVVAAAVGGIAALSLVLKVVFGRPRPDLWEQLISISSYAFPSAHAMVSAILAACLIYLSWKTRYVGIVAIFATVYALVIAFSRLYLGVHYPTDIIGGWILSVVWMGLVLASVKAWRIRHAAKERAEQA